MPDPTTDEWPSGDRRSFIAEVERSESNPDAVLPKPGAEKAKGLEGAALCGVDVPAERLLVETAGCGCTAAGCGAVAFVVVDGVGDVPTGFNELAFKKLGWTAGAEAGPVRDEAGWLAVGAFDNDDDPDVLPLDVGAALAPGALDCEAGVLEEVGRAGKP